VLILLTFGVVENFSFGDMSQVGAGWSWHDIYLSCNLPRNRAMGLFYDGLVFQLMPVCSWGLACNRDLLVLRNGEWPSGSRSDL